MMKKTILLLAAVSWTLFAWAQTPPPGTISRPPTSSPALTNQPGQFPTATNLLELGHLSFTNSAGAVYSVDQFAGQLQNLRGMIEQTLPMLSAFTETYSNTVPGGPSTLGGTISNILSGVLSRGTNATGTPGQTTPQSTNLLAALQQSLTRNAPASTPVKPTTFPDVLALQERLQTIPPLLQTLNVGSSTNQFAAPSSGPSPGRSAPTGR